MRKLVVKPTNFPIPFDECPRGHFILANELESGCVYLKSSYPHTGGQDDCKCMVFSNIGTFVYIDDNELVFPVEINWEEE